MRQTKISGSENSKKPYKKLRYYLGEPEELFYWGPSRATPMYMGDFMAAIEQFFTDAAASSTMPSPPKTLALFWQDKVVWLINAREFSEFTQGMFKAYESLGVVDKDISNWHNLVHGLDKLSGSSLEESLLKAWGQTLFAEFSLYGAEIAISKRLARFDEPTRQEIWGAFTMQENSTFIGRIDEELKATKDPKGIAEKYPWIQDGYLGLKDNAEEYFTRRLHLISDATEKERQFKKDKLKLAKKFKLSKKEVSSLDLARKLAEFMDDRKAWMMQTRRLITKPLSRIEYGWCFENGKATLVDKEDTRDLWLRYVNFKSSTHALEGLVASNGGRHFVNGEVALASSPTDSIEKDKILVVPATSPSYIPLMRNARAIVTDHGGVMSHAAIVARELGLPCIVGTKRATKILKDGDKIVLDLVKGEISR